MGAYFELGILFLFWALYLATHSWLASDEFKAWVASRFPAVAPYYRLIYTVVSTLGLLGLAWLILTSQGGYILVVPQGLKLAGMVLGSWGVFIISVAFRSFPISGFLGVKPELRTGLVRSGIHGKIRHPIYAGTIVVMIGMTLAVMSWAVLISTLTVLIYLPVGIYYEERKLIREFGEDYLKYKKEVPAVIPRFSLLS
jgi:protein-S-isoprenylcysteine O-methyltransferase Ste14